MRSLLLRVIDSVGRGCIYRLSYRSSTYRSRLLYPTANTVSKVALVTQPDTKDSGRSGSGRATDANLTCTNADCSGEYRYLDSGSDTHRFQCERCGQVLRQVPATDQREFDLGAWMP